MPFPDAPPQERRVRWIGRTEGDEFGPCYAQVEAFASVTRTGSLADAVTGEASHGPFDLTVLACERPLVATAAATKLATDKQAGRLVQLLGVWCEGEGRTGRVVEGAERVFWHAWPGWWSRWLTDAETTLDPNGLAPVWVQTTDNELAHALIEGLAAEGVAAVWTPRGVVSRPGAIVWDGAQFNGLEADRLARVCHTARRTGAPVLALLDFPRPETVTAAYAVGASAVLGKPFERELLLETLAMIRAGAIDHDLLSDHLDLPGSIVSPHAPAVPVVRAA